MNNFQQKWMKLGELEAQARTSGDENVWNEYMMLKQELEGKAGELGTSL